jgi:hypothetical protein
MSRPHKVMDLFLLGGEEVEISFIPPPPPQTTPRHFTTIHSLVLLFFSAFHFHFLNLFPFSELACHSYGGGETVRARITNGVLDLGHTTLTFITCYNQAYEMDLNPIHSLFVFAENFICIRNSRSSSARLNPFHVILLFKETLFCLYVSTVL